MITPRTIRCLTLSSALVLTLQTGCFSFGGRTTHVHESPEMTARLAALEGRVAQLEQSGMQLAPAAAPSSSFPSMSTPTPHERGIRDE